jgi:hypothetical protein
LVHSFASDFQRGVVGVGGISGFGSVSMTPLYHGTRRRFRRGRVASSRTMRALEVGSWTWDGRRPRGRVRR